MTDPAYNPFGWKDWPAEDPYSFDDHNAWPPDYRTRVYKAFYGIHDGDLQPLADLLRSGQPLPPMLAESIADAIEGKGPTFRLTAVGMKRGQRGATQLLAEDSRRMKIGTFMEDRIRAYGKGGYAAALDETCKKFTVKKTTAEKHHKHVLEYLSHDTTGPDIQDPFERLQRVYLTHYV